MTDNLNGIAWADFMRWALEEPHMRAEFEAATGIEFKDSARYVVQFVEWATLNHYGLEHAPKAYRDSLVAKALR